MEGPGGKGVSAAFLMSTKGDGRKGNDGGEAVIGRGASMTKGALPSYFPLYSFRRFDFRSDHRRQ